MKIANTIGTSRSSRPISTSPKIRRACRVAALLAATLLCSSGAAPGDEPVRCELTGNADFGVTARGCCATANFDCNSPADAADPTRMNVLLLISDDQNYCNYSFMAGHCANDPNVGCWNDQDCNACSGGTCTTKPSQPCNDDSDCWDECVGGGGVCSGNPATQCATDDDCGADAPCYALRLSDPSCRNRQPPRRKKGQIAGSDDWYCENDYDDSADNPGVNSFPFDRSNVPCTGTPDFAPVLTLTPHLDRLAAEGVLFTQARVGGNTCKAARSVLLRGKPHRHLQELPARGIEGDDIPSIAFWLEHTGTCSGNPATESKAGEACRADTDCNAGQICSHEWRCNGGTDAGRDCSNDENICSPPGACVKSRYRSFLVGKGEVVSEEGAGFDGGIESKGKIAKVDCPSAAICKDALDPAAEFPKIPTDARNHAKRGAQRPLRFIFDSTEDLTETGADSTVGPVFEVTGGDGCAGCAGASCPANCTSKQVHPFMLWWAPKLPHYPGKGLTGQFGDAGIYHQHYPKVRFNLERVSQFDLGMGALLDELNRTCVCSLDNGVPTKKSVLDNTIIVFLTDHGRFLPRSKGKPTDNNHRTPMIVSLPGHRNGTLTPAVYGEQMAHSIDVLRTVLSRAGIRYPLNPAKKPAETDPSSEAAYPFARDLSPCLFGDAARCPTAIRRVSYGEDSSAKGISSGDTRERYMILEAPGVCETAMSQPIDWVGPGEVTAAHAKPCYNSSDCGGSSCNTAANSRCINDPTKHCTTTTDCVANLCGAGGRCTYDTTGPRSFGDRAAPRRQATPSQYPDEFAPCSVGTDCIPCATANASGSCTKHVDLCRPIRLKVAGSRQDGKITRAWDLHWDPDETRNLLADDPDYLGTALNTELEKCLDAYWDLDEDASDTWTGNDDSPMSLCAWPEPTPDRAPYSPPSP